MTGGARGSGKPTSAARRHRLVLAALVVLVGALGALALAGLRGPGSSPADSETQAGTAIAGSTSDSDTAVPPPAGGAWIGAFVQPEPRSGDSTVQAVRGFESQLGRPLDVVHVYHGWEDEWPSAEDRQLVSEGRILLLSWAGTDTRDIASGRADDLIRARARALAKWGEPVLLQWRWEMDRPNLQDEVHSPEDYIAAWRRIRDIFATEGADNASWVWCPLATGFVEGRAQPYYPGDDVVDWICADVYPGPDATPFATAAGPFLTWAADHPKPIVIGEFGMRVKRGEKLRQQWLADIRTFVKTQPQIKALVYFDIDRTAGKPSYDMSLRNAPGSMAAFARMADDPYYDVRSQP